jgi:pyruvate,orthophosphate dikinase
MTDVHSFASADGMGADLLGGKGAGLAAMLGRGLNVPPGFIITTRACAAFRRTRVLTDNLMAQVRRELDAVEVARGRRLGDPAAPLLIAVRSGAAVSMPGMMDTVLNLGVNADTVDSLGREFGAEFARDSYGRFLECFGTIVLGIDAAHFGSVRGTSTAPDARAAAYLGVIEEQYGPLPADPEIQLRMAIEAVFRSWDNPRAQAYRRIEGIDENLGTAVVVQSMVFGNLNEASATGVVFTRNPNSGERVPYGDILFRAQGEDVVSGRHQTLPIAALANRLPQVWTELTGQLDAMEAWRNDMLDIEFTVEDGRLYFLQVRSAKRSAAAAVRVALSLVHDGRIGRSEAVKRVQPAQLDALTRQQAVAGQNAEELVTGLPVSPGLATGQICLSAESVLDCVENGDTAILVRAETSPDDVHGMAMAEGILTARGGLVSHAAVVARSLAVPAVVGADAMRIDHDDRIVHFGTAALEEGELITIDGDTGVVTRGRLEVQEPPALAELDEFLSWIDEFATTSDPTLTPSERLAAAQRAITGERVTSTG